VLKKTLTWSVSIRAPRSVVWDQMLGAESYKRWTSAFTEGSYYEGAWEEGRKIRFLGPNGDGMVAEIAESRTPEFVSIRHLGEIAGGVEDTTSDKVRAWAPAYENYTFADSADGTTVTVTLDCVPEYEAYMNETFPKALDKLKQISEAAAGS
jgi:hypothetical protein